MIIKGVRTLAPLAAMALVAGCAGGSESEPASTVSVTETAVPEPAPTVTETVTPEPAPTVTETVTVTPEPEDTGSAPGEEVDRTDEIREIAGDSVREAVETSTGQIVITTSIIDPRGEDGSPEARQAVEICEAVQQELGVPFIRVEESDGTTFVILGTESNECVEV